MATVLASDAEAFRDEVRTWLDENLVGEYRALCGRNDLGDADEMAVRKAWEQQLAKGGWVGLSWPDEHGGRAATLTEELIFNEEYARADGPQRCGFFGEQLLGPTLMAFGTMAQQERFLGPILRAEEFWCQGFSEPDAGSDLANIKTTAVLDGDRWRINGQKVWTSLGHIADWIFVVCRTDEADGAKHRGLDVPPVPDGPSRRRTAPDPPDDRHGRVQRGVLRRRHAPPPTWSSARSAAAGRS